MKKTLLLACLLLPSAALGQAPAPLSPISIPMTAPMIEANINIMHEFVKGVGLTQPQRVQEALALLGVFQAALKADVDARAKTKATEPNKPEEKPPQ